jgi:hypothetical protein
VRKNRVGLVCPCSGDGPTAMSMAEEHDPWRAASGGTQRGDVETQGQVLNRAFRLRRLPPYSTSDHQTDCTGVHACKTCPLCLPRTAPSAGRPIARLQPSRYGALRPGKASATKPGYGCTGGNHRIRWHASCHHPLLRRSIN